MGGGVGGGRGEIRALMAQQELGDAKIDWRLVLRAVRFARPWWPALGVFGAFAIGAALVGTVPPLLVRAIIDDAIRARDKALLLELSAATVGVYVARALLSLGQSWQAARVGAGMTAHMRTRLHDHIQRQPIGFFLNSPTGAVLSRVVNDVQGAQRVLTSVLSAVTTSAFTFVATAVTMVALDWRLALVVLLALPGFILPSRWMGRALARLARQRFDLVGAMSAFLHEHLNVSGSLLATLYGDPATEEAAFAERAEAVRRVGVRTAVAGGTFALLSGLYATMSTALVYWVGGWRAITSGLSVGTVVAFGQLASRAYAPAQRFAATRVELMTALVSFERVFEVLELPNPVTDREGAIDLASCEGRVEYDAVAFRYPTPEEVTVPTLRLGAGPRRRVTGDLVLDGVTFAAAPGDTVALVGASGAGKTTTLHLLPRLADPSAGVIRVDGHDLRDLTLESLRRHVGVVSQDSHLFHDSVLANLLYARPDATLDEVEEACRIARIHESIAKLPDGYGTVCGEQGHRFSGGERQRLAIARVVLKDPAIVVLDEATAHLDSVSEQLVAEALAVALRGRTTLVIAHRLSTVRAADRIVVLDRGRVVQVGTHADLAEAAGPYRELHLLQGGSTVPSVQ